MLLEVKHLKTEFKLKNGIVNAVDDVSFSIDRGEILAIVGESGSGKSVTSLSIMGLISEPGKISGGEIFFNGSDLCKTALERTAKNTRRSNFDDLSGADDLIEPGSTASRIRSWRAS